LRGCGDDQLYLVIFKNTQLKTIRDLTNDHVTMLADVKKRIEQWLQIHDPGKKQH
jgi:hypothetical protein